jgi:16S rRNA (uracil1498-N3)-methyltransferase
VMRVKVGEVFSLFNSSGEWVAKILTISKSIVEFNITKQLRQKENVKELWLAFSPIKSNYFNFMIQKATELGVTKFIPIIFDRTIVRKINKERLEKVIIEAAEQSNRINVPSIEEPQSLKDFLSNEKMDLIFTDLNSQNKKIDLDKLTNNPTCVIIGPEGDFSEEEREKILSFKGVQPIKINENILRSETAVISALSIVSYLIN